VEDNDMSEDSGSRPPLLSAADIRAMAARFADIVEDEQTARELARVVADEVERAAAPLLDRLEAIEREAARRQTAALIRKL